MPNSLSLREVQVEDLSLLFEYESDPDATYMAGFTVKDPGDREAYMARWDKILSNGSITVRSILSDEQVVGSVLSYEQAGRVEVSYWIGKQFWGKGIATWALTEFLQSVMTTRPIHARAAKDNIGSCRILEKCGFEIIGEAKGFANARGQEIEEFVFELRA